MYAKIIESDAATYNSPVLCLKFSGFSSWAVVFDKSMSALKKIDYWSGNKEVRLNLLLLDFDTEGYKTVSDNLYSIWKEIGELSRCKSGKFSPEQLEEAKAFIRAEEIPAFSTVTTEDDLKALSDVAFHFRDGCFIDIEKNDDKTEYLLDTTWGSYIKIRADGNIKDTVQTGISFFLGEPSFSEGRINFSFKEMITRGAKKGDEVLSADHLSFRSYFEKRLSLSRLKDFTISRDEISLSGGKFRYSFPVKGKTVYYEDEYDDVVFLFEDADVMYRVCIAHRTPKADEFCAALTDAGFTTRKFEAYYDDYNPEPALYTSSEKRPPKGIFPGLLTFSLLSCIFRLARQTFSGIALLSIFGVSVAAAILFPLLVRRFSKNENAFILVYEAGIRTAGKYPWLQIAFKDVKTVENKRNIVIYTSRKIKLPRTKDKDTLFQEIVSALEDFRAEQNKPE